MSDHFVDSVKEGGVAEKSGLKKGDRIIEVDGVNVEKVSIFIVSKIFCFFFISLKNLIRVL